MAYLVFIILFLIAILRFKLGLTISFATGIVGAIITMFIQAIIYFRK